MSEKEKEVGARLAEALNELELPDTGKEYLIGYAEGLAAMAQKNDNRLSEISVDEMELTEALSNPSKRNRILTLLQYAESPHESRGTPPDKDE